MVSEEAFSEFSNLYAQKCGKPLDDVQAILKKLLASGLVDKTKLLRSLIRYEYWQEFNKSTQKTLSIRLDLAVKYDVSEAFVRESIYTHTDLNL